MASKNSAFGDGHKGAGGTPVPTTETTPLSQGVSEGASTQAPVNDSAPETTPTVFDSAPTRRAGTTPARPKGQRTVADLRKNGVVDRADFDVVKASNIKAGKDTHPIKANGGDLLHPVTGAVLHPDKSHPSWEGVHGFKEPAAAAAPSAAELFQEKSARAQDPYYDHPGKHDLKKDSQGRPLVPHMGMYDAELTERVLKPGQSDQNEYAKLHQVLWDKKHREAMKPAKPVGTAEFEQQKVKEALAASKEAAYGSLVDDWKGSRPSIRSGTVAGGARARAVLAQNRLTNTRGTDLKTAMPELEGHIQRLITHVETIGPKVHQLFESGSLHPDAASAFTEADTHIANAIKHYASAKMAQQGSRDPDGVVRGNSGDAYLSARDATESLVQAHHALRHPAFDETNIVTPPPSQELMEFGRTLHAAAESRKFKKSGKFDYKHLIGRTKVDLSDPVVSMKFRTFLDRHESGLVTGVSPDTVASVAKAIVPKGTKRLTAAQRRAREEQGLPGGLEYAPGTGGRNIDVVDASDAEGRQGTGDWSGSTVPLGIPGKKPRGRQAQTSRERSIVAPIIKTQQEEKASRDAEAVKEADRVRAVVSRVDSVTTAADRESEADRRALVDARRAKNGEEPVDWDNTDLADVDPITEVRRNQAAELEKSNAANARKNKNAESRSLAARIRAKNPTKASTPTLVDKDGLVLEGARLREAEGGFINDELPDEVIRHFESLKNPPTPAVTTVKEPTAPSATASVRTAEGEILTGPAAKRYLARQNRRTRNKRGGN